MKRNFETDEAASYALTGKAALIPGMQFMLDKMQAQLDVFRAALSEAQVNFTGGQKRRGRPPGKRDGDGELVSGHSFVTRTAAAGWPADPEERKAEMRRRMKVAAQKRGVLSKDGLHPRDAGHPEHDQWLATMRRAQKKAWKAMTDEQRADRIAKATAGRLKKQGRSLKAVA